MGHARAACHAIVTRADWASCACERSARLQSEETPMNLRLARWACVAVLVGVVIGASAEEPAKTVKVAAVQCSSELGDVAGNRTKITSLVEEAAAHGAKIV